MHNFEKDVYSLCAHQTKINRIPFRYMTKKQNIEHATNWNAVMVLWGFMLMLFIALSLFVPDVPVPWLHWICGLVPSARYMVSVSLFPNVASTVFSVMWGLTPLLIFFYLQRLHFTPCSIEEFRKNKILNFFLIGILMPAMIISSLFLPDNESVGFTGDINKLISESRLFLGVFGALFTAVLPLFIVGTFKWFVLVSKIYFNK